MKKLFLCFCTALLIAGCSDSDSDTVNETPNTATGQLSEIRKIHHDMGSSYTTVDLYTDGYLMRKTI